MSATDFFKRLFGSLKGGNNKKLIENLVIFLIILIIFVVVGGNLWGSDTKKPKTASPQVSGPVAQSETLTESAFEQRLSRILSQIRGVGKTSVMVAYDTSAEAVPVYDLREGETVTEEKDSGGGVRKVSEKEYEKKVVFDEKPGGIRTPMMAKQITPRITGVIVAAEGANDIYVQANIVKAVEAVANVPSYKVQVFEKQKND